MQDGALEGRSDESHGGSWLEEASPPVRRTIKHGRASIEACYKALQRLVEAFNAKRTEPANAQDLALDKLLAIGLRILDSVQIVIVQLHHNVFPSPLFEACVVEIDNGSNGEGHEAIDGVGYGFPLIFSWGVTRHGAGGKS